MERLGYNVEQVVGGDLNQIIPESITIPHTASFSYMNFNRGVLNKRDEKLLPMSRSDGFI